jgi:NAD(P)-dependent dehydrogenase (short-subunit alcohol dehydrogenase family)
MCRTDVDMTLSSATPAHYPISLDGHCVVVTGAGRGLGRHLAVAAARAGARVVGLSRTATELEETATLVEGSDAPDRLVQVLGDIADPATIEACVAGVELGSARAVDVLHGAGTQVRKPAHEVDRDDWARVMETNLTGPFFLSTALGAHALDRGRTGSHVFVGSLASHLGLQDMAPYAATKSGLLGVMRSLAVEWASRGLRANALCPGYFRTALTAPVFDDPARRDWIVSRIPMRRPGEPEDLSGAALFLLSDASSYITGQTVNVDGGWTSG